MSNRKLNRESPFNPEQFSLTKAINEHRQKSKFRRFSSKLNMGIVKKKKFFSCNLPSRGRLGSLEAFQLRGQALHRFARRLLLRFSPFCSCPRPFSLKIAILIAKTAEELDLLTLLLCLPREQPLKP